MVHTNNVYASFVHNYVLCKQCLMETPILYTAELLCLVIT